MSTTRRVLPRRSHRSPSPFSRGLLDSCRAGDERAWNRLFQASAPMVAAIARVDFGLHREDAEDIVQLVHLKLYEHLEELRDPEAFAGWLRRLTRRTILDMLRQKRQMLSLDALAEENGLQLSERPGHGWGEGRSLESDGGGVAVRLDVQRALADLPSIYREPVVYFLLDGRGQDEIGRLLGRPRSTVATQIQRGIQKLRRFLEGEYGSGQ